MTLRLQSAAVALPVAALPIAALPIAALLIAALGSGCATGFVRREDSALLALIPTPHSISPRFPSEKATPPVVPSGGPGTSFDAEAIVVEEPSYHEAHPLAWQRELKAYTAKTLNAAAGVLPEPPLSTTVQFTTSTDYRDVAYGAKRVHVEIVTTLIDGRTVRSADAGDVVLAGERGGLSFLSMVGVVAPLGAMAVVDVLALVLGPSNPVFLVTLLGLLGVAGISALGTWALDMGLALNEQQRWSDLYLAALIAHGRAVRAALVEEPATPAPADAPPVDAPPVDEPTNLPPVEAPPVDAPMDAPLADAPPADARSGEEQ